MTWRSFRSSPTPPQVGHGCDGIRPRPRHCGHGRLTENPPCPNEMVPRPPHSGQVEKVAPGAPPVPVQVGQISFTASVHRDLATEHRYTKRDLNNRLERIADRLLTSAAPEDGREDVAEATEIAEIDSFISGPTRGACTPSSARRPGTSTTRGAVERAVPAHTIVLGPLLRIRQGRVRLGNFLEAFRGFRIVRIGVGVILLGEPAVRFLDVVLACRVRHAEDLIEVLRGHVTLDPALSTPEPSPGGPASP